MSFTESSTRARAGVKREKRVGWYQGGWVVAGLSDLSQSEISRERPTASNCKSIIDKLPANSCEEIHDCQEKTSSTLDLETAGSRPIGQEFRMWQE